MLVTVNPQAISNMLTCTNPWNIATVINRSTTAQGNYRVNKAGHPALGLPRMILPGKWDVQKILPPGTHFTVQNIGNIALDVDF
jgi:hypothetical protein